MYDLRRIRYVTQHYPVLRGMTLVPYSLWLLGWAAYDAEWIRVPGLLSDRWVLGLTSLAVVVAMTLVIRKLYDRAFGWISPDPQRQSESRTPGYWAPFLSLIAIFFLTQVRPETSFVGVMSLAPLLDGLLGPVYPSVTVRDIAIKVVAAVGLLVVGTMDHLTLVRTLGPIRHEEESRA